MKTQKEKYHFTLYMYGQSINSLKALENLRNFCEKFLPTNHEIEVVDLAKEPDKAAKENILAIPTTVIRFAGETRKLIGTLNNISLLFQFFELNEEADSYGQI